MKVKQRYCLRDYYLKGLNQHFLIKKFFITLQGPLRADPFGKNFPQKTLIFKPFEAFFRILAHCVLVVLPQINMAAFMLETTTTDPGFDDDWDSQSDQSQLD